MYRCAFAFMMGLALLAQTSTVCAQCGDEFAALQTALDEAEIGGGNPDRTRASLQSKIDGAIIKLDEGKIDDAIQKLVDIQDKVDELLGANKPKISEEDAAAIYDAAQDVIDCIEGL